MRCVECGCAAVTERPERTAQGYRRFRCRQCGKQFNERSGGLLNRAQYPSDVIALVVLWRLRYKLALRDLPVSGAAVSHSPGSADYAALRRWTMCGCPSSRSMMVETLVCMVVGAHRAVGSGSSPTATNAGCGLGGVLIGVLV